MTHGWSISCTNVLKWIPLDLTDHINIGSGNGLVPQATSHYLSQCWPRSLSPYGVIRPQYELIDLVNECQNDNKHWFSKWLGARRQQAIIWNNIDNFDLDPQCHMTLQNLNPLQPRYTIWRHESGSTLAQIMACCLMAPSHYSNQCWLLINGVLWHSPMTDFTESAQNTNS